MSNAMQRRPLPVVPSTPPTYQVSRGFGTQSVTPVHTKMSLPDITNQNVVLKRPLVRRQTGTTYLLEHRGQSPLGVKVGDVAVAVSSNHFLS